MAQETWWQWIWRILWIPIAFFTGIDYQPNQLADEGTVRGIEFEKYYEKKYGENHVPMFKGSFDEVLICPWYINVFFLSFRNKKLGQKGL